MYYSMTTHTGSQSHEWTWPPPTQHWQQLHTGVVSKWWIAAHILCVLCMTCVQVCTYICMYVCTHLYTHLQLYNCSHTSTTTNSITTATRESCVQVVNTCTALYLGTPSQVPHVHTCLNCKMVLVSIIYYSMELQLAHKTSKVVHIIIALWHNTHVYMYVKL